MDTTSTTQTPEQPAFAGYTMQEAYDKVCKHLARQKERSMQQRGKGGCAYRGTGNRTCAIGCLMPDELWWPEMESLGIGDLDIASKIVKPLLPEVEKATGRTFLMRLQEVHDDAVLIGVEQGAMMATQLCSIAHYFDLKPGAEAKLATVNWRG